MNEFTASNGTRIEKTEYGTWFAAEVIAPDSRVTLAGVHTDALREFFRAEEDERLGRWRWLQDPRFVVYPWYNADDPNPRIAIVDEATGGQMTTTRATVSGTDEWAKAARAYFDAHTEVKPWHDAKPGDVYVVTWPGSGIKEAVVVPSAGWPGGWECVTAAERIWDSAEVQS